MSDYARWCATIGRGVGAALILIAGTAAALRSWAPLTALPGPVTIAALVYSVGTPAFFRDPQPPTRTPASHWDALGLGLRISSGDPWPAGSIIDKRGYGCTHAGCGPCNYHGRHIP
jgi:hypothetical protein